MNRREVREFRKRVQALPMVRKSPPETELNKLRQYRDYVESRIAEGILPEVYATWDKRVIKLTKELNAFCRKHNIERKESGHKY